MDEEETRGRKRGGEKERGRIQEAGSFFNVSPDIVDRFLLLLLSIRKIRRTNSEKIVKRSFHLRNACCKTTDKYVASFSTIKRVLRHARNVIFIEEHQEISLSFFRKCLQLLLVF